MTEEHIMFPGADLKLEGILHLPQGKPPFPAVVVCHPHPLYGGSMYNNVVLAICDALAEATIVAFRFNFRGVGKSKGNYSEGIGEQEDVKSALAFLTGMSKVNSNEIGLAGYSFGTKVALPVAIHGKEVRAIALVSPFLSTSDWGQLKTYVRPKLFLCGSEDHFISPREVQQMTSELPDPYQYEVIHGADHFWSGYEEQVAEKVSTFFTDTLKADMT